MPQLKKRKSRTSIVNLASSASFLPGPYSQIYHCTKVFDRFFSQALRSELLGTSNIDVMTVCPMYVQTNMIRNMKPSWLTGVTSADQYVDKFIQCLSDPKGVSLLVGPPQHTIQTALNQIVIGMILWYRFTYHLIERICKGVVEM
jgi:short-subunit dehydrogenase